MLSTAGMELCNHENCRILTQNYRKDGVNSQSGADMTTISLSAELQLHLGRRVVKSAPAYVVRHVVNAAPAEVFSRIARDNEVFYFLESSFFLRPSFLLARSQLGRQPSSIFDLVAPSPN